MTSRPEPSKTGLATAVLTLMTAAWGSSFFLTKDLLTTVPAADFLAVRFTLAAAVMTAVLWRHLRALSRRDVLAGVFLGTLYGVAQILQTYGLALTSASRSGFITGMYVILTPIFGALLLRARIGAATWLASVVSLAGLAVLSLGSVGWGAGESLTFACAVLYAGHILGLGAASRAGNTLGLSAVQLIVVALACTVAAVPTGIVLPATPGGWTSLLYLSLVCGAAAMWAQTWGQAHLSPTRAAIVMTTEPVFAAAFAIAFGGESLTWRLALGGALVLAAMYLAELGPRLQRRGTTTASVVPDGQEAPPSELRHHQPGG